LNGRTVKTYVGRGPVATIAARMDAEARARCEADRAADRTRLQELQAMLGPLDALRKDLDEGVRMLTAATLLAGNFRQHKGTWRLKRGR
jgi:hypothetical protein